MFLPQELLPRGERCPLRGLLPTHPKTKSLERTHYLDVYMFSGIYLLMDNNIDKIWKEYWDSRDNNILLKLMNVHVQLVETIAYKVLSEHPTASSSFDDLFIAGLFALKDAIESFSPDCKVQFEIYCSNIVRQAMLDELKNPSVPLSDYMSENW